MNTLFPATLFPSPTNPQRQFPPWKQPKASINLQQCFTSNKYHTPKSQARSFPGFPDCQYEPSFVFNDWPQLLKSSIGSGDLDLGQAIHACLVKLGRCNDVFVGNNLVNFYSKFNALDDARRVFDEMLVKNTITWTSLIKGYLESDDYESVFRCATDMYRSGEKFNEHTCSVVLKACESQDDLFRQKQVHAFVIKSGLEDNVILATSLISTYMKSSTSSDAEEVFNNISVKDVRCLNSMILEYERAGYGEKAIVMFIDILRYGMEPDDYSFTNVISACSENVGFRVGLQLHGLAIKYGYVGVLSVGNAIVKMYGRQGMVKEAERIFSSMIMRSLISWTTLISCYARSGNSEKAIYSFLELLETSVLCDSSLLATVFDVCSECKNSELARQLHSFAVKLGYSHEITIGTALVDLYAKCGNHESARTAFDCTPGKTTASFNALLAEFMETNGDVMGLFNQLQLDGMKPDVVTFSRLLSLSANQASAVKGESLYAYCIKAGFESDLTISNAVITMYAKCGNIQHANLTFNHMNTHDSISWNAIISAYALHGKGKTSLQLFQKMKERGFIPDEITILSVLQACAYSGLCEQGIHLFNEMEHRHGVKPAIRHFSCMVDLLGRAGRFSEAMDFIQKSPFVNSPLLWRTLVNTCKLLGDMNFGLVASKTLLELRPEDPGSYMTVSNMYVDGGMLDEAAKVRTAMNDLKLKKEAGCSWIEIDSEVHCFVASDRDHKRSSEIYDKLNLLRDEIKWNHEEKCIREACIF